MTKAEARTRLIKLRQAIDQYRYDYHVLDRATISPAALDSLKHELSQIESLFPDLITPDSPSQRVAGQPLPGFTKVRHTNRMWSLADAFSETELRDWDQRWRKLQPHAITDYLVDLKLDGLAINLRYDRGLLIQAATRGDGLVGEDVTLNVRTIEAVPLRLRTGDLPSGPAKQVATGTVEVRGEVVMLKHDFARLNKRQASLGQPVFANPRNVAAGSIRQLDARVAASRTLSFYAWELVTDLGQDTLADCYRLLTKLGLPVNPKAVVCHDLNHIIAVHRQVNAERDKLPFWIDGVVVKINMQTLYQQLGFVGKTPRAAVAWKFSAAQVTTVVKDIVVQVGRTGALTPVAHLEPVEVAGTTVSRATLHNADEVARLDVRVGDTVILQKAGDIIPEVVKVLHQLRPPATTSWVMPTHCPVCRSKTLRRQGEVATYCPNPACLAQHRESLYHFVSKKAFDITGLGPSTVDVLIEENLVKEPADFFHLQAKNLIGLPLFAELKSDKLIAAIKQARRVRLDRCIYALGIRHVGEQTAIDLAMHFGSLDKFITAAQVPEEIAKVKNIGPIVANSIHAWLSLKRHQKSWRNLIAEVKIQPMEKLTATPISGQTVVVTGTLDALSREEAEEAIRAAGGQVSSSVSAKTNLVVVGKEPGSKAARAAALGVRTINESEFLRLIREK